MNEGFFKKNKKSENITNVKVGGLNE